MTGPAPKPGILEIPLYAPGKASIAGIAKPVKLSANENALGCSAKAREAFLAAAGELHLYPDMQAVALREAIAAHYGLEFERLTVGAGSDELFAIACRAYLEPGDNAVQPQFGFAAWPIVVRAAGGVIRSAPERDFHVDVDAIVSTVDARTRIVFVANPANPTGTQIPFAEIARLHAALPESILLVIDGAYAEFSAGAGDYAREFALARAAKNILVTRTFSKLHGLAALRLGWGYAAPSVIAAMERMRLPFNTTRPAQAAAIEALADGDFAAASIRYVARERAALTAFFASLGLGVLPSAANFVTVRFGASAKVAAGEMEKRLAARGILVRALANYGLDDCLRVTIGPQADLAAFRAAFAAALDA
jgi:histidinol-phosphate aminotransferase